MRTSNILSSIFNIYAEYNPSKLKCISATSQLSLTQYYLALPSIARYYQLLLSNTNCYTTFLIMTMYYW